MRKGQKSIAPIVFVRRVCSWATGSRSLGTWRKYLGDVNKFATWAAAEERLGCFPPSPEEWGDFCEFLNARALEKGTQNTLTSACSTLKFLLQEHGFPPVHDRFAERALVSEKRRRKEGHDRVDAIPDRGRLAGAILSSRQWGAARVSQYRGAVARRVVAKCAALILLSGCRPADVLRICPFRSAGGSEAAARALYGQAGGAKAALPVGDRAFKIVFVQKKNAQGGGSHKTAVVQALLREEKPVDCRDLVIGLVREQAGVHHAGAKACKCASRNPRVFLPFLVALASWRDANGRSKRSGNVVGRKEGVLVLNCSKPMTADVWRPLVRTVYKQCALAAGLNPLSFEPRKRVAGGYESRYPGVPCYSSYSGRHGAAVDAAKSAKGGNVVGAIMATLGNRTSGASLGYVAEMVNEQRLRDDAKRLRGDGNQHPLADRPDKCGMAARGGAGRNQGTKGSVEQDVVVKHWFAFDGVFKLVDGRATKQPPQEVGAEALWEVAFDDGEKYKYTDLEIQYAKERAGWSGLRVQEATANRQAMFARRIQAQSAATTWKREHPAVRGKGKGKRKQRDCVCSGSTRAMLVQCACDCADDGTACPCNGNVHLSCVGLCLPGKDPKSIEEANEILFRVAGTDSFVCPACTPWVE